MDINSEDDSSVGEGRNNDVNTMVRNSKLFLSSNTLSEKLEHSFKSK